MNKLISDVLLWTSIHGHTRVGQPTKADVHQLCADVTLGQQLQNMMRLMLPHWHGTILNINESNKCNPLHADINKSATLQDPKWIGVTLHK